MLKDNSQMCLPLSPYQGLYDVIISKNHLLRRIKENIDFSFVNPMLRKQYCEHFGRSAKEPEMMFKLLFLKNFMTFRMNGWSAVPRLTWHTSISWISTQSPL